MKDSEDKAKVRRSLHANFEELDQVDREMRKVTEKGVRVKDLGTHPGRSEEGDEMDWKWKWKWSEKDRRREQE